MTIIKKEDFKDKYEDSYDNYASLDESSILLQLKTDKKGLSNEEFNRRIEKYGLNSTVKKKKKSIILEFLSKFLNPLIILLVVIAIVSIFMDQIVSSVVVTLMILISVIIDFIQERKSTIEIEKLNALVSSKVFVFRNNERKEIDIKYLVPGDIVELRVGDIVPADIRIIESKELFVSQASLTGESFPIEKNHNADEMTKKSHFEYSNLIFMGSNVVSGMGLGVVIKTGEKTEFGKISESLSAETTETSFNKGTKNFTMLMIKLICILTIFIFVVMVFFKHQPVFGAILFALAVAIGLTPEMLPTMISINLSNGARRMAKKKVIVKRLEAIQNFGAMDVLCTDKTGTLTLDAVTLEIHCNIKGEEDEEVLRYSYINSYYQTGLRNVLDKAILNHENVPVDKIVKIDEIPFDFNRRLMSIIVNDDKKYCLISKGAPEAILKKSSFINYEGKIKEIDDDIIVKFNKLHNKLSEDGFRVLAIAIKNISDEKKTYSNEDENQLTFVGFVAFLDPAKPSVKKVIEEINAKGVEIKVLTGDNEIVTRKICTDVNLKIKGIITGDKIESLSDTDLKIEVEKNTIFARLSPIQKERVIKTLKSNDHIVGYLGDGINDAPSLRSADIGISVDSAVPIAKESADIILLERDLEVLHDGILEGRKTFGNIVKYIRMSASSNFGNMLSMTGATLFLPFLPMLPVQIIINNFLYDISNIALPSDDVDKEFLEKPRPWKIDFIKKFMFYIGPISSIFDFITFGVMIWVFNASANDQALFHTGWFIESLFTQTLIIYIIRTNKIPFIESKPSTPLILGTIIVLMIGLFLPYSPLATYLGFTPLPMLYFFILAGILVCYLSLVMIIKRWIIKKYNFE